MEPDIILSVIDIDTTKSNTLKMYKIQDNGDVMLGWDTQINDLLRVQYFVFNPVLVEKNFFRGKKNPL